MGIKGLWKLLESFEEHISVQQFAVEEGFIENKGELRGLRVGVNASSWICHHEHTMHAELAALFARCARLLNIPFFPVFVFDQSAGTKHNKCLPTCELVNNTKAMLDCFGYPWLQAPGEAEAELAYLSRAGILHAVLTDNSDAAVFGTTNILWIQPEDDNFYTATFFSSEVLAQAGLGCADLILIALLVGSEHSGGLTECGVSIAQSLAQAGLGVALIEGLRNTSDQAAFIKSWVTDLQSELRENRSGFLTQRQPKLADAISSEEFPDMDVLERYLHPLTSEGHPVDIPLVSNRHLDLLALARFAQRQLAWSSGILRYFASWIFPGLALRELVTLAAQLDMSGERGLDTPPLSSLIDKVVAFREHSTTASLPEVRVDLAVDEVLVDAICKAVGCDRVERFRAWLPFVMMHQVFPNMYFPDNGDSELVPSNDKEVIDVDAYPDLNETRYTKHLSFSSSGHEIIEFETDSEGSV